ncbi:MAG: stage II sporulation protein M [Nanoarchaeota archaeon]
MKKRVVNSASENWRRDFADLFEESWNYVLKQKKYIYAVALIFVASSLLGFAYSDLLDAAFADLIKEIISQIEDLDFIEMFWFIFSNNVTSSLFGMFLGVLFGIFPFFNALFNGTLIGYVYAKTSAIEGYGVIWRLFPHGVFELPAVFISLGLGVHLGAALFARDKKAELVERGRKSLHAFLTVVVPLLILAALIESTFIFFIG